ncbi:M23 family metallopeptidase [Crossiella sp. NPDC003009]
MTRALLRLGLALAVALGGLAAVAQPAAAAPAFQLPFPCNQVWEGQTRTGHSPQNSVDFNRANDEGDPVLASAAGRVSRVANEGSTSYGRWIEIDHGGGWTSRYAHLSSQEVSVGTQVARGRQIGKVGNTGGSTGAHLHYEQRLNGADVRITFNGSQILYFGSRSYTSRNCGGGGNPYTPEQVCGSGYGVVDEQALGTVGRTYLLYNNSNGNNCVVTLKSVSVGTASAVSAFLEVQGEARTTDSGNFTHYAGPVRKAAPGKCVKWGGSVGSTAYTSGFEHCGS